MIIFGSSRRFSLLRLYAPVKRGNSLTLLPSIVIDIPKKNNGKFCITSKRSKRSSSIIYIGTSKRYSPSSSTKPVTISSSPIATDTNIKHFIYYSRFNNSTWFGAKIEHQSFIQIKEAIPRITRFKLEFSFYYKPFRS